MAMYNTTLQGGFLLVDKPSGITSFTCVKQIKRIVGRGIKIGHAGTLDSFATGLLIIAITRNATRRLDDIMTLDKRYVATGKLGQLTDTLDLTGEIQIEKHSVSITREQIEAAIHSLGTRYMQIPPIYSAHKHRGKRLSDLARKQRIDQEMLVRIAHDKKKPLVLYDIKLTSLAPPYFTITAHVSHGTYIRVLLNDIAQKCNNYATTHELRRTTIGPFAIEHAIPLSYLESLDAIQRNMIPIEKAMLMIAEHRK